MTQRLKLIQISPLIFLGCGMVGAEVGRDDTNSNKPLFSGGGRL
jgi:hypothetical protein